MTQKYRFTPETITVSGHALRRIECINTIPATATRPAIPVGTLGGFIERESNLSHEGSCWVDSDSLVYEDAVVRDNALITHHSCVHGTAIIRHNTVVKEAHIKGDALVGANSDYRVFTSLVNDGFVTWTASNDCWCDGEFFGSASAFIARAYRVSRTQGEMHSLLRDLIYRLAEDGVTYDRKPNRASLPA